MLFLLEEKKLVSGDWTYKIQLWSPVPESPSLRWFVLSVLSCDLCSCLPGELISALASFRASSLFGGQRL